MPSYDKEKLLQYFRENGLKVQQYRPKPKVKPEFDVEEENARVLQEFIDNTFANRVKPFALDTNNHEVLLAARKAKLIK